MVFYLTHAEDDETQKKGWIVITIHLGVFRFTPTIVGQATFLARILTDFPVRIAGQHNLLGENNAGFGQVVNMYLKLVDKETRSRYKCHYGMYVGQTVGDAVSECCFFCSPGSLNVFFVLSCCRHVYGMDVRPNDIWDPPSLDPSDCRRQDQIEEPYGIP
jgi:hypothetical protein